MTTPTPRLTTVTTYATLPSIRQGVSAPMLRTETLALAEWAERVLA